MPWRVFGVIGLLIVITAFSALNLDHRADVSFGVYTLRGVPVFLTALTALILGAVLVVPLTVRRGARRPGIPPVEDAPEVAEPAAEEPEPAAAETTAKSATQTEPEALPEPVRRRRLWPFSERSVSDRNTGAEPGNTAAGNRDASGGSG